MYTKQETKNMETVKGILKCFTSGNTEPLNELVHDNFINHHAPEGIQDKAGFFKIVGGINGQFSSFKVEPTHLFAKDNYVSMMDTSQGTLGQGEYSHIDFHVFIMKDGKMYEHWNSFGLPCANDKMAAFLEKNN